MSTISSASWRSLALLLLVGACGSFKPPSQVARIDLETSQGPFASLPSKRLVAVADDGVVRLHDGATGEALAASERMPNEGLRSLAMAPNGTDVALLTYGGTLAILTWRGTELATTAKTTLKQASSQAAPPVYRSDGALAVGVDVVVDVWLDGNPEHVPVVLEVGPGARELAFRHTDGMLAIAFEDRVETWDVASRRHRDLFLEPMRDHVAFSPSGALAAGGSPVVVRDAEGTRRGSKASGCDQIVWDPAGDQLACRAGETTRLCSLERCDDVELVPGQKPITFIAPAIDGLFLFSGDGRVMHRASSGRSTMIPIDGVADLPRGGR